MKSKSDYSTTSSSAYQYVNGTNRLNTVALKGGGTETFGYDDKGNQTKRNGTTEVVYNVFNKPTAIDRLGSQVSLFYDANWSRYKQIREVDGVEITTHYIDKLYEVEFEEGNAGSEKASSYISDVAILIEEQQGAKIRFTHKDRLGSSATFTDHNGNVTAYRSYDPFGKPKMGDGGLMSSFGLAARLSNNLNDSDMATRRGFTDHEHLDEVEIIHMNGRVYDYNVGRFLSVDPFVHGGSQGINPYSYIMNNPLAGTDPTGYKPETEVKTKKHYAKAKTGTRIRKKSGETKTTTVTDSGTGEILSKSVVSTTTDGNYSGSNVNYSNGNVDSANVFSGNKNGESLSATMDFNSQGEISKVSTLESTRSESGEITTTKNSGPVMLMGFTEASGHKVHGQYHAFVLALDPKTNKGHIARGGPTMSIMGMTSSGSAGSGSATNGVAGDQASGGSGFGAIRASDGVFSNLTPFDQPNNTRAYQMLGRSNHSFNVLRAAMMSYSRNINKQQIPYFPTGPNSNSFAFSFAQTMGYRRQAPNLPSIGWEQKL